MGLLAGARLGLELPRKDRRLLVIAETDGCFVDALAEATGCRVGARTLRIEDCGKVAATFVDVETEEALRMVPHPRSRSVAAEYAPGARSRWHAQMEGYQHMPEEVLLTWQPVALRTPLAALVGRAGERVACAGCGEEIINQRVVVRAGRVLCRSCAGEAYYRVLPVPGPAVLAVGAERR